MNVTIKKNSKLFRLFLVIGFLLEVMVVPSFFSLCMPPWLLLILFFCVFNTQLRPPIWSIFFLGLLLDRHMGVVFGLHSIALLAVLFFLQLIDAYVQRFALLLQTLLVCFSVLLFEFIYYLVVWLLEEQPLSVSLFYPVIVSIFVWPFLYYILSRIFNTHREY